MIVDLEAATDAAMIALYDPAAVPDDFTDDIDGELERSSFLLCNTGGDGDFVLKVFLDERPPAALLAKGTERVRGGLRVPSGRLWATGAEELSRRGADPDMGEATNVPPGDYAVELIVVDHDEIETDAVRRKAMGAADFKFRERLGTFTSGGCWLLVATVLSFVILPWHMALLYVVLPVVVYWVVLLAVWSSPYAKRVDAQSRMVSKELLPCALVVLEPLADAPLPAGVYVDLC